MPGRSLQKPKLFKCLYFTRHSCSSQDFLPSAAVITSKACSIKDIQLGCHASGVAFFDHALASTIMNQDTAGLEVGDHTLVGEWAKIWLKNYKSDLRAATIKMYRDSYNLHIMEQIGYMELRNVKPVHIRQVMASVASRSESLQRKVLLTMRQLFEEARLNHLIIDNPTEGIKITPHAKAEKKKALLPDEVDILMSVVVEPRARVFCALCLYCGLRKEEALGLQWSDIQSNSLTVRRAMTFLNNQQDPVDDLKTKAAHRVIPIPDKLRAILLDTPHLSRYIVPASNGGDMTRSAFTRMWNSHVVFLVPFPLHPHMLRHTYATTLYRARVDLRTAQKLMGHSSIQVTADIYTHLEQEDSLHVADKLNEYLSGKSENSVKSSQKVVKLAI